METKSAFGSWTIQGLFLALTPLLLPLFNWPVLKPEDKVAAIVGLAGWLWAFIGRLRQGDLHVTTPRVVGVFLLTLVPLAAACQTAPQVAAQTAHLDSGAPQSAPVDQGRSFVYAPTWVIGSGTIDHSKPGIDAAGDVKAAESLRTGTTQGGSMTSTPTQDNSGLADAAVKAAETFLSSVDPTSAAGALAKKAVAAAKAKAPDAAALLEEAKKADAKPGTAPPQ